LSYLEIPPSKLLQIWRSAKGATTAVVSRGLRVFLLPVSQEIDALSDLMRLDLLKKGKGVKGGLKKRIVGWGSNEWKEGNISG